MNSPSAVKVQLLCAVSVLAGSAAPASLSTPAAALTPPQVIDGRPDPEACARFGYRQVGDEDRYVGRPAAGAMAQRRMALPPNVAPPPPAPPPPSPAPAALEEIVVATGKAYAPSAPMADALRRPNDTEKYPDATSNPIRQTAEAPVSTFSIDVDTASYANVRRFITDGQKPPRDAVRVEELVNYFDYGYPRPTTRDEPFKPYVAVTPSPWSTGKQILHIGLQGYAQPSAEQPPLNLVFLVDVSGSMNEETKLPLAKKALNVLIDRLRPEDRVAMVVYAGNAGAVLEPTDGRQKLKMRCALESLSAGGSTAGGEGLALAYRLAQQNFTKGAVNRVVLMTDGDFNVGVTDNEKLEDFVAEKRKTGIYLSVYGFGRGNYNDVMMQTLAQSGNGTAGYIDSFREANKLFRDDFSGSIFPIADDVKIQVEFNPRRIAEYRLIGYETRMLNREDFNNDQVDAGEVGSGASVTALYEISRVGANLAVDPLRYPGEAHTLPYSGELAYLKVRYKLPGGTTSKLIERPIGAGDIYASLDAAPEATRWAEAVAGWGQKLRGDPWVSDSFGWDSVATLAKSAKGEDPFGLRSEFIALAGRSASGRSVNE